MSNVARKTSPVAVRVLFGATILASAMLIWLHRLSDERNDDLYRAVRQSDVGSVRAQLAAGASVDFVGPNQATVLKTAILAGQSHLAYPLNSKGVMPSSEALDQKARMVDCAHLVMASKLKSSPSKAELRSLWFAAASLGFDDLIPQFLAGGIGLNERTSGNSGDTDGSTALVVSTSEGHASFSQELLRRGADANIADIHGESALIAAQVHHPDPALVAALIAHHADVNHRNNRGDTALIWSSRYSQPEATRLLIAAGSSVNYRTPDGDTALLAAVNAAMISGNCESLQLLVRAGAACSPGGGDGATILRWLNAEVKRHPSNKAGCKRIAETLKLPF